MTRGQFRLGARATINVALLAAFHANLTELQCVHDHFSDAEDDDVGRGESNGT